MATTDKNTLKQWFSKGAKPLAEQFAAWIDAFWHKDEMISAARIEGLQEALNLKADSESLTVVEQTAAQQLQEHNYNEDAHGGIYNQLRILKTIKQTAAEFNASTITEPCYVKITDDGTISMDANFFAGVEPEILFYLQCAGQILITDCIGPEDAYTACSLGMVRELSVYMDSDEIPVVTVFEKPLKTNNFAWKKI